MSSPARGKQVTPTTAPAAPLVSVITAVYNAGNYLEGCIRSVLNQTYPNVEYIVIDGGSTDNTVEIINRYRDQLTYWVSEPDKGIYDAWNKGLAAAKGDWIAFIGADDVFYPDALQAYVDHVTLPTTPPNLEFVSSRIELVKDDLSLIRTVGAPWEWDRFKINMITWHVGCFHSRRLFERYGVFNPVYKVSGDYELLLRPKDRLVASFIDQPTVRMRMGGVSSIQLFNAIDETYKAKVANGILSHTQGAFWGLFDKTHITLRRLLGRP